MKNFKIKFYQFQIQFIFNFDQYTIKNLSIINQKPYIILLNQSQKLIKQTQNHLFISSKSKKPFIIILILKILGRLLNIISRHHHISASIFTHTFEIFLRHLRYNSFQIFFSKHKLEQPNQFIPTPLFQKHPR